MASSYTMFFALFNRAKRERKVLVDDHHELVADYFQGRHTGLSSLSKDDLRNLERHLQELVDPVGAAADRMRRKVIAILASHGMTKEGRPDMAHINAWCTKYGFGHKPLNNYANAELPRLVTQAEHIVKSDLKAIAANG